MPVTVTCCRSNSLHHARQYEGTFALLALDQTALHQFGDRLPNRGLTDVEVSCQEFLGRYLVSVGVDTTDNACA
jgi:hypothetical protein